MNNPSTISSYDDIDIHELLKQRRLVAVFWGVEDVQSVRPDLNDEQAWEVLSTAYHKHDCELGFNWSLIETIAELLYPELES